MEFCEWDEKVRHLYDDKMSHSMNVHDLIFSSVFSESEYIGQYSDNSASDLLRMAIKSNINENSLVLDIGSGPGGPACFLVSKIKCKLTGIDISKKHLQCARLRAEQMNLTSKIRFLEKSVWEINIPKDSYDVIIGTGAWCHLNTNALFPLIHKWLKPDGHIAFMERVKLLDLSKEETRVLCDEWACPKIESIPEYCDLLYRNDFSDIYIENMTNNYKEILKRCIKSRIEFKTEIINMTNDDFFEKNLQLSSYEEIAAQKGKIGYAMFVAKKS